MNSESFTKLAHDKLLAARSVAYQVSREQFSEAIKKATPELLEEIKHSIENLDANNIARIIQRATRVPLVEMSVRQLRALAQSYGVPYYSTLPKANLLSAIVQKEKENDRANTTVNGTVSSVSSCNGENTRKIEENLQQNDGGTPK